MRAIVFDAEEPSGAEREGLPNLAFLRIDEVPTKDLPAEDWVVIKSGISGICGTDLGFLQGKQTPSLEPYTSAPFVPGHELSGTVEATGSAVRGLSVGDRVVVDPGVLQREHCESSPPGSAPVNRGSRLRRSAAIPGGCGVAPRGKRSR